MIEDACVELEAVIALAVHAKQFNMVRPTLLQQSVPSITIEEARNFVSGTSMEKQKDKRSYTFDETTTCNVVQTSSAVTMCDEIASLE